MSSKVNNPIRQHTVPESYLKRFAGEDGMLHLFDRRTKQFRREKPKQISVIKDYYTVEGEGGSKSYEIERNLAEGIENDIAPVFERLSNGDTLQTDDLAKLHAFMAIQSTRGPAFRDAVENVESAMLNEIYHMMFADKDRLSQVMKTAGPLPEGTMTTEELFDGYKKFGHKMELQARPARSLAVMVNIARERCRQVAPFQDLSIFRAPRDTLFVVTDIPIISYHPPQNAYQPGLSFMGYKSAVLYMPIDNKTMIALRVGDPDVRSYVADRDVVRYQNIYMAELASRFVCSPNEAHLKGVVRRAGIESKEPKEMFGLLGR